MANKTLKKKAGKRRLRITKTNRKCGATPYIQAISTTIGKKGIKGIKEKGSKKIGAVRGGAPNPLPKGWYQNDKGIMIYSFGPKLSTFFPYALELPNNHIDVMQFNLLKYDDKNPEEHVIPINKFKGIQLMILDNLPKDITSTHGSSITSYRTVTNILEIIQNGKPGTGPNYNYDKINPGPINLTPPAYYETANTYSMDITSKYNLNEFEPMYSIDQFKVIKVNGDGSCFYHSIMQCLKKIPNESKTDIINFVLHPYKMNLRKSLNEIYLSQKSYLTNICNQFKFDKLVIDDYMSDADKQNYDVKREQLTTEFNQNKCDFISKYSFEPNSNVYAHEEEIMLTSFLLKITIVIFEIYNQDGDIMVKLITAEGVDKKKTPIVHIINSGGNHFDALIPIQGATFEKNKIPNENQENQIPYTWNEYGKNIKAYSR